MPPAKRQRTGTSTSKATKEAPPDASSKHNKEAKRDTSTIPPYEYVCIRRPVREYEAAERKNIPKNDKDPEATLERLMEKAFAADKLILLDPASEHEDHKWIMMWDAWKKTDLMRRRARYCDPDAFGMYIYNDWHGYGLREIMEHQMLAFEKARKKKGEGALEEVWALLSSLGYWLNEDELGPFIGNEDGERVCALTGLMGCALLTALSAIEDAGELTRGSKFKDLALCISNWLEFVKDLPAYGIEGDAVFWSAHAVAYYEKAGLKAEDGGASTAASLKKLKVAEDADDEDMYKAKRSKKDPWAWNARFRVYKRDNEIGSMKSEYDITKMSKTERAQYAFDRKDPLAGIPAQELRDNLLWCE